MPYVVKSKTNPDEKLLTSLKNAVTTSIKDSKVTTSVTKTAVLKVKMPSTTGDQDLGITSSKNRLICFRFCRES